MSVNRLDADRGKNQTLLLNFPYVLIWCSEELEVKAILFHYREEEAETSAADSLNLGSSFQSHSEQIHSHMTACQWKLIFLCYLCCSLINCTSKPSGGESFSRVGIPAFFSLHCPLSHSSPLSGHVDENTVEHSRHESAACVSHRSARFKLTLSRLPASSVEKLTHPLPESRLFSCTWVTLCFILRALTHAATSEDVLTTCTHKHMRMWLGGVQNKQTSHASQSAEVTSSFNLSLLNAA